MQSRVVALAFEDLDDRSLVEFLRKANGAALPLTAQKSHQRFFRVVRCARIATAPIQRFGLSKQRGE